MAHHRSSVPTSKTLITTVVLEFLGFAIISYPLIHIYLFLKEVLPVKRGFFCDDENLKHPVLHETITTGACFGIWASVILVTVLPVEILYHKVYATCETSYKIFGTLPWVFVELYRILGFFSVGALCSVVTTELTKFKVGRLRPYFLTLCHPNMSKATCLDGNELQQYIEDYKCSPEASAKAIKEASKSFYSGHASFSFYCATFLIVFLHARLSGRPTSQPSKGDGVDYRTSENTHVRASRCLRIFFRGLRIMRPFLQFGAFMLAFFIALTRITDFKHHPTDVIAGGLFGACFAVIILTFVIKLFDNPVVFSLKDNEAQYIDEEKSINVYLEKTSNKNKHDPLSDPFALKTVQK